MINLRTKQLFKTSIYLLLPISHFITFVWLLMSGPRLFMTASTVLEVVLFKKKQVTSHSFCTLNNTHL